MTLRTPLGMAVALILFCASANAQTEARLEPAADVQSAAAVAAEQTSPEDGLAAASEDANAAASSTEHRGRHERCAGWRRPQREGLGFVLIPLDLFRQGLSALRRGITC